MNITQADKKIQVGVALCGSFCTIAAALEQISKLTAIAEVTPIVSYSVANTDTRFFTAEEILTRLSEITQKQVIATIAAAEPIGPKKLLDALIVAPCTGNTLAKLTAGIADTPVTLAVKAHLRNNRPVILAISTNDGLGANAKNLGELLNRKNYFFVPFAQDDSAGKPNSLVARYDYLCDTLFAALKGEQLQPLLKCN